LKEGYRHGKQKTDEKEMQTGFDIGFQKGVHCGKVCGVFYAQCLLEREHHRQEAYGSSASTVEAITRDNIFKRDLKNILYDDFDVSGEEGQLGDMLGRVKELFVSTQLESDAASLSTLYDRFREEISLHMGGEDKQYDY
jgi:hypothetical protein